MTKCGEIIKNMLLGLAGTVVMICLAVSLTVWFRPLYYFDIDYLDIPQSSGVSAELCRLNYDALIDYNVPGGSAKLMFPTMPMSESGRIHFAEVKMIFAVMQGIALAGLALLALCLFWDAARAGRTREAVAAPAAEAAQAAPSAAPVPERRTSVSMDALGGLDNGSYRRTDTAGGKN